MWLQQAKQIAQEAQTLRGANIKNHSFRFNQLVQSIQQVEQCNEIRLGYFLYPLLSGTAANAGAVETTNPQEVQRQNLYQHFCQKQPSTCDDLHQSIALLKQARNDMAATQDGSQFVPSEPQRLRRATVRVTGVY
mmetsp:Transcript_24564/g.57628  ORF Transcript_24564/g.57628 Transcript_24564/m.57628 type:complete len:135 (-) Transcript_24564:1851-2255(-)